MIEGVPKQLFGHTLIFYRSTSPKKSSLWMQKNPSIRPKRLLLSVKRFASIREKDGFYL